MTPPSSGCSSSSTRCSTNSAWALRLPLTRRLLGTAQPVDGLAHPLSLRLQLSEVPLQLGDPLLASSEAPLETALLLPAAAAAATPAAAAAAAIVAAAGAVTDVVVAATAAPNPVSVAPTADTGVATLVVVAVVLATPATTTLPVTMTLTHRTDLRGRICYLTLWGRSQPVKARRLARTRGRSAPISPPDRTRTSSPPAGPACRAVAPSSRPGQLVCRPELLR